MKKHDYIPKDQLGYLAWQDQLNAAASGGLAITLGLTPGDLTDLAARNANLHTKYGAAQAALNASKSATADYNTAENDSRTADRNLVQRLKLNPACTPAIAQTLGIVGADDTTDLATSKPTLTGLDLMGGNVQVQFNKSISQGVEVYSKRDGDADFGFLARDTQAPYLDNRPLLVAGKPEMRHYKAIYIQNDAHIGSFSDEIVVTCQP